ncbi:MAG TPA: hypothetical protein VJ925_06445, partial [Longimicrobiales bacterium]|nr:hypothetical protein [Longimicrobiales bacterium]
YVAGGGIESEPVWVARDGAFEPVWDEWTGLLNQVALSASGARAAITISDGVRDDLWIRNTTSAVIPPQRVTFREVGVIRPVWYPNGDTIAYIANEADNEPAQLFGRRSDGVGEPAILLGVDDLGTDALLQQVTLSDDARWAVYRVGTGVGTRDIYVKDLTTDAPGQPLIAERFNEHSPDVSPDAAFVAYVSNESGSDEVYVRTFPDISGGKWVVSSEGGTEPVWSPDGTRIFYRDLQSRMIEATWVAGQGISSREVLFDARPYVGNNVHRNYDVHPDGERFFMLRLLDNPDEGIVWIENFAGELEAWERENRE